MAIKKKKKKLIIAASSVLVLGIITVFAVRGAAVGGAGHPVVAANALVRKDLRNTVNVTGNVESTDKTKVYTRLQYPVLEVFAEVGDLVKAGDILCQLDTKDLVNAIASNEASLQNSRTTANTQLSDAQRALSNAQNALDRDFNTALITAEQGLTTAEINLRTAENGVRTAENSVRTAESGVSSAQSAVSKARINMDSARDTYRDARDSDAANSSDDAYRIAQINHDDAVRALDDANRALGEARRLLEEARVNVKDTEARYWDASTNLEKAKFEVNQQMEGHQISVGNVRSSMDFTVSELALENLREDLENCTVTAPVSGTVTAVYIEEGASPAGLMFVIEDTNSLMVTTRIAEFDVTGIEVGAPVELRSDATGGDLYTGRLSWVAPTSVKTAQGNTDMSSEAQFEAEVAVIGSTRLKIGMRTRLNIVYEEKRDVFAVSYDAVTMDEMGATVVFVARTDENGDTFVHSVGVELGMETDFDTEVISDLLSEGDMIVSNPEGLADGMRVTLFSFEDGMIMSGGMMPGMPGMRTGGSRSAAVRVG